jgi:acetyl-CoA carboxylase beta subunit
MSGTRTFTATKYAPDHFEPEDNSDPQAQRKMRGLLEQIDYTAFASNKALIGQTIGEVDAGRMQRLAVAAAAARARWVAEALAIADSGPGAAAGQVAKLTEMRAAFMELTEAYEALRRMVERGYVTYRPSAA